MSIVGRRHGAREDLTAPRNITRTRAPSIEWVRGTSGYVTQMARFRGREIRSHSRLQTNRRCLPAQLSLCPSCPPRDPCRDTDIETGTPPRSHVGGQAVLTARGWGEPKKKVRLGATAESSHAPPPAGVGVGPLRGGRGLGGGTCPAGKPRAPGGHSSGFGRLVESLGLRGRWRDLG